jgi:hypothetical protein
MAAEDRIAELEHRLGLVEDALAIRNLQHAYGYYLDKCYYDEVVDLFDPDGEVIFIGGVYRGRAGIARLYTARSTAGSSTTQCSRTSCTSTPTGAPATPGSAR